MIYVVDVDDVVGAVEPTAITGDNGGIFVGLTGGVTVLAVVIEEVDTRLLGF